MTAEASSAPILKVPTLRGYRVVIVFFLLSVLNVSLVQNANAGMTVTVVSNLK
jgi:hypothetical protein